MSRRKRKTQIEGQFTWRLVEMLESAPFRALSRAGHRILDRLEIELAHHGGTGNGTLKVPYGQFQDYGIDRESVAPAIREVVALGFVEITKQGRGGNAEYRVLTEYRLTYKPTDFANPTNEWRSIGDDADAIAAAARKAKDPDAVARSRRSAGKQNFGADTPHVSGRKTRPENQPTPGRETRRSVPGRKTRPTIYISGEHTEQSPREARPLQGAVASGATLSKEPLERADILQAAIAARLGRVGWPILQDLEAEHLQHLMALEDRGDLGEDVLVNLRRDHQRKEAAA